MGEMGTAIISPPPPPVPEPTKALGEIMVAVSQTDTVWSIWSGVEDYLECDTRLEKYPLEK